MDRVIELLPPSNNDASSGLLALAHELLCGPGLDATVLPPLLTRLASLSGAVHAGLADAHGNVVGRTGSAPLPWTATRELLSQAESTGVALLAADGISWLIAALRESQATFVFWLEAESRRRWTYSEASALLVIAEALQRRLGLPRPGSGETLRELTASVTRRLAHDYGNVLTGIAGFAELAKAEVGEGSPIAPYLDEIHRASQQGTQLTVQLRQFGRRSWPAAEPSRLAAALQAEEKRLRTRFGANIRLEASLPPDLPPLTVGMDPLRQLLTPLLDNAAEANKNQGTIHVTAQAVTLKPADCETLIGRVMPGPAVEIRIVDQGPGLSAAATEKLLVEPFFSDKPRRGGLGLGTAYGILHVHKGGFSLGPGPQGGTAVRVCLPAAQPEKVLVVDDDPMIRQFVCATLERAGYRVVAASHADEALAFYEAAGQEPFRLVLADVMMPGVSGFELAQRLVRQDTMVNVLFMSGQGETNPNRPESRSGGFPLLTKPFRPDGLLSAVRAALEHRPRTTPPAVPRRAEEAVLTSSR